MNERPKLSLPEIVLAGRSNVGKSSLINVLLHKSAAKVSSIPGKTQRMNFFLIDNAAFLIDLPGYGYAKAPQREIDKWSQAIDDYLHQSERLQLILLLIDIRRPPSKGDMDLIKWATAGRIPLLVIFTKRDKLSEVAAKQCMEGSLAVLPKNIASISFSHRDGRRYLIQKINTLLKRSS